MKRRVAVITTGGTIASRPTESTGVVAQISGDELVESIADSLTDVTVRVLEHGCKNAFLLTPDEMLGIAKAVRESVSTEEVDGVVVTHGTDTMEETAFLTDLVYGGSAPVVFTGAQRHAGMAVSDGSRNLLDAIRIAASPIMRDSGVSITLEGRIDAARYVTKMHTWALRAFGTHGAGSLGAIGPAGVHLHQPPAATRCFPDLGSVDPAVHLVKLVAGIDGTLIDAARAAGATGIVVEAFGLGNTNHEVLASIEGAIGDGVVVAVASRCPEGGVFPVYGNGGGYDVAAAGALFAANLSGQQARILMMAALASAAESNSDPRVVFAEAVESITGNHLSTATDSTFDQGARHA